MGYDNREHDANARRRAVFLNRAGVINRTPVRDKAYAPRHLSEFRLLPGVSDAGRKRDDVIEQDAGCAEPGIDGLTDRLGPIRDHVLADGAAERQAAPRGRESVRQPSNWRCCSCTLSPNP